MRLFSVALLFSLLAAVAAAKTASPEAAGEQSLAKEAVESVGQSDKATVGAKKSKKQKAAPRKESRGIKRKLAGVVFVALVLLSAYLAVRFKLFRRKLGRRQELLELQEALESEDLLKQHMEFEKILQREKEFVEQEKKLNERRVDFLKFKEETLAFLEREAAKIKTQAEAQLSKKK